MEKWEHHSFLERLVSILKAVVGFGKMDRREEVIPGEEVDSMKAEVRTWR